MTLGAILRQLLVDAELNDIANGINPVAWLRTIEDYDWTVEDGGPPWRLDDE